jgi:hypothetical protein
VTWFTSSIDRCDHEFGIRRVAGHLFDARPLPVKDCLAVMVTPPA